MKYQTTTAQETEQIGKKIAQTLTGGAVVLLYGELGAGKTTLVKGIARALGVKEDITSPTFTLLNIYDIKTLKPQHQSKARCGAQHKNIKTLVHIDTYRLEREQELIDIGVEDYLGSKNTVCVIEWPEKLTTILKSKKTIKVLMENIDKEKRKIIITNL